MDAPKTISIRVDAEPLPMERPRLARSGVYIPTQSALYVELLTWIILKEVTEQHWKAEPQDILSLEVTFSRSSARRVDIDNLIKPVLDAGTRAGLWVDDSQLYKIVAFKEIARESNGHTLIDVVKAGDPVLDAGATGRLAVNPVGVLHKIVASEEIGPSVDDEVHV